MTRPIIDRICDLYSMAASLLKEAKTEAEANGLHLVQGASLFNPLTEKVVIQFFSGPEFDSVTETLEINPQITDKYGFIKKSVFYRDMELYEISEAGKETQ